MVEKSDHSQRLPEHRECLNNLRVELADHLKASHPRGFLATSCHPCMNYKWQIEWQEWLIREIEAGISDVSQAPS